MRTLIDGREVEEYDDAITLSIITKCPEKWHLKDMETGEEYIGNPNEDGLSWRKINEVFNK